MRSSLSYSYPRTGDLNKQVIVRKRQDLATADNQTSSSFPVVKTRWANIKPVNSSLYLLGVQTDSKITHRITLRYLPEIDSDYEIVHKETVYRVVRQIDLDGSNRFTAVDVVELTHNEMY